MSDLSTWLDDVFEIMALAILEEDVINDVMEFCDPST